MNKDQKFSSLKNSDLRENIIGARNKRSISISLVLFLAGLSFFLVGLSSFLHTSLFPFTDTTQISFLPQGITMLFYGSLALGIAFYLLFSIFWNIGSGYNTYSKNEQCIRLVRLGFPGKKRDIFLSYNLQTVKKLKFFFKQGINPRATIFLVLKDQREIPLYPAQSFLSPLEVEKKAIELSEYLNIPLENLIQ